MRASSILVSLAALLCLPSASRVAAAPARQRSSKDALYMLLIERSSASQTARVKAMLDAGVPVNVRFDDADHDTPLTQAAGSGHLDVVRLLLERGANPNARNANGRTALWNAAYAPLSESGGYTMQGPQPPTPAERGAWADAYCGIIHVLIRHGANPNIPDDNGMTPLGFATCEGREAEVAALLQGGANPNRRDQFGKTPLQWAAYIGFPRIVAMLRAHGAWIASPGLAGPKQRDRDERLVAALSRHDVGGVRRLLAHGADANAHVNLWNKHSPYMPPSSVSRVKASEQAGFHTPLLTSTSSPLLTRLLLQHGANPNAPGGEGEVPLLDASANVARLLLWRGAHVDARAHDGDTPLIKSASDPAKVALLLSHGANVRARDEQGLSALLCCGDEKALKLLLSHGADINEHDSRGRTALIRSADSTWGEGDAAACDAPWSRVLLRHGADPNARDSGGNTALMLLAAQGDYGYYNNGDQLGLVRLLLASGARRELRNRRGLTALQIARHSRAPRVARLLRSPR